MKHTLLTLMSIATLSACGFQPLYGPSLSGDSPVAVTQIDGRMGHRVRQELARMLASGLPNVEPGARVEIDLKESLERLSLKSDAGVSRSTMVAIATYQLVSNDGEVLISGRLRSQSDFDVSNTPYGDIALQNDARERVALSLARSLRETLTVQASKLGSDNSPDN